MADPILLDIIDEHLPYELGMFRGLYLQFGQVNPAMSPGHQQIQYYAQINSFCVHARSLLDFFGTSAGTLRTPSPRILRKDTRLRSTRRKNL